MPQVRKTEEQTAIENRIKKKKTLLKNQTLQLNTLKSRQKADRERKRRSDNIAKAQGEIDRAMCLLSGDEAFPSIDTSASASSMFVDTDYRTGSQASALPHQSGSICTADAQSNILVSIPSSASQEKDIDKASETGPL